jgi:hypothetical protein
MPRRRTFDHDQAVADYLADPGCTFASLALRYGVSTGFMGRLVATRIVMRDRRPCGRRGIVSQDEFRDLHWRMSHEKMALLLGCTRTSVRSRAERLGLIKPKKSVKRVGPQVLATPAARDHRPSY